MQVDSPMIENLIRAGVPQASIRVEDIRGDGQYYTVLVVSPAFQGLPLMEQHRMVYATLSPVMGENLEAALQLTTRAA